MSDAFPSSARIQPVLLSGGSGTRLWPLSRELYPKQFLRVASDRTMLQETMLRLPKDAGFLPPIAVCNSEHRFVVAEQLREIGVGDAAIILEPAARNTAPALALAALYAERQDPDCLLLVLPSDHKILSRADFIKALALAATQNRLVTFGMQPENPETGYGYIRRGAAIDGQEGVFAIDAFKEKPSREKAEEFIADERYSWNGGMFLFPLPLFLREMETFAPEIMAAARKSMQSARKDLDFIRPLEAAFAASPSISIDYALMEKTKAGAVIPCAIGWSDLGSWDALWAAERKDEGGNAVVGNAVLSSVKNSYIRSEDGILTAVIGAEDLVVVTTGDAVLIARRGDTDGIKKLVARLKEQGAAPVRQHQKIYRPWGSSQSLGEGERFQVKRLTVTPGGKLSLQKHAHRSEHWVVVNGTARVTRDSEVFTLQENESVYLPQGCVHRLENPGTSILNLIEVQSGSYLGEDDIVRLEDSYGRSGG